MAKDYYLPIEDYGIIGDLNSAALVGKDASIDFFCHPYFNSPSIFAALLDKKKGGHFQIHPMKEGHKTKQQYLPDSNILVTRFLAPEGVVEVTDFMPILDPTVEPPHQLIRRVKSVRGEIAMRMICEPAFDYGRCGHRIEIEDGEALFYADNDSGLVMRLRTSVPLREQNGAIVAEFNLTSCDEEHDFILEQVKSGEDRKGEPSEEYATEVFQKTLNYWQSWMRRSTYRSHWQEMVNRSALVLKLLTSRKHGSIVAAPTFSLPEAIPGTRNWDYRFTWIRDASFTLYAFIRFGFTEEAGEFMNWIEDRTRNLKDIGELQVLYNLDGSREAEEIILPHLEGYRGTGPVRVGNAAVGQLQLDIYGELMDAIYLYNKYGSRIHHDLWMMVVRIVDWVCENWHRADDGIWESRGERVEYLYSRLMCWVAIDRAVRLINKLSLPGPIQKWHEERSKIYYSIMDEFWNEEKQAFVQYKGATELDAACLIMPLVKFISPTDPRWLSTMAALEKELVEDMLVYRYSETTPIDQMEGTEGSFSMCTFWYVENLCRSGQVEKARLYFEKMLSYSNHLGLYAEEIGPSGEHLGNFPQAFTHLALVSAAYALDDALGTRK